MKGAMMSAFAKILAVDEPPPVKILRPEGASPIIFVCDHASNQVPRAFAQLGLQPAELARHIGWDIGTAGLGAMLAEALDATTMLQTYSRLVIDCNRPPGHSTSIAAISDRTRIPGNQNLSADARRARENEIFWPYQHQIAATLDARMAAERPCVLVSLHSFTPVFQEQVRFCHIGMLFDRDPRLGHALGALLRKHSGLVIADNEPYALDQITDYTIPIHGEQRGIVSLEIEVRQDLIADAAGQKMIANVLAPLISQAVASI